MGKVARLPKELQHLKHLVLPKAPSPDEVIMPTGLAPMPQVRGYPMDLRADLTQALRRLDEIERERIAIDLLDEKECLSQFDMMAPKRYLRTYKVRDKPEIIQIALSETKGSLGLWQTHREGRSILRLELLRRTGSERICREVLAQDGRRLGRLGARLGIPGEVCDWIDYRPKNQQAWKLDPQRIVIA